MLNELVRRAAARGCKRLLGVYLPTAKNDMVREHYPRLGFSPSADHKDGNAEYVLDLAQFAPVATHIRVVRSTDEST